MENKKVLVEAPDESGFLSDEEIEAEERAEFEKRLAQRKADRDSAKAKDQEKKDRHAKAEAALNELGELNFDSICEKLVPKNGKAETVAGEVFRAIQYLNYRFFNDGDVFSQGYGRELCGNSAAYLYNFEIDGEPFWDFAAPLNKAFDASCDEDIDFDVYNSQLLELQNIAIKLIQDNPELLLTPNEDDSRSGKEFNIDGISDFDLPKDKELQIYLNDFEYDTPDGETVYLGDYVTEGRIEIWDVINEFKNLLGIQYEFEIDTPWTHHDDQITITDMDISTYESMKDECSNPSLFESYLEELYDKYGDPNEMDEKLEEGVENESLDEDKLTYEQKILASFGYGNNLKEMSDDNLGDLMNDIINEREGIEGDTKKGTTLDDLYNEVDGEIQERKAHSKAITIDEDILPNHLRDADEQEDHDYELDYLRQRDELGLNNDFCDEDDYSYDDEDTFFVNKKDIKVVDEPKDETIKVTEEDKTILVRDINVGDIVGEFETIEDAEKFIEDDMGDHNYEIVYDEVNNYLDDDFEDEDNFFVDKSKK